MYRCVGLLPDAVQQYVGLPCAPLLSDIVEGMQVQLFSLHSYPALLHLSLEALGYQLEQDTTGTGKFMQQLLSRGWARIVQASGVMGCVAASRHACAQLGSCLSCDVIHCLSSSASYSAHTRVARPTMLRLCAVYL